MNKSTVLFRAFKNEPHRLLYIDKVADKEPPFLYYACASDNTRVEIPVEDTFLTPMDKYAKGGAVPLMKGVLLSTVYRLDETLVSEETVSHLDEVPVPEREEEAQGEEAKSEAVEILRREDDRPAEKFEQISIFGDDDMDI